MPLLTLNILLAAGMTIQIASGVPMPQAPTSSMVDEITPLSVTVKIPRRTTVGTRKAGFLCVPEGRFKIEDFVSSESSLRGAIAVATLNNGKALIDRSVRSITLTDLKVNLCARDYIFDKRLYSGKATFTFLVRRLDGSESVEKLALEIDKGQSQSEGDILELAASNLVSILTDPPS